MYNYTYHKFSVSYVTVFSVEIEFPHTLAKTWLVQDPRKAMFETAVTRV